MDKSKKQVLLGIIIPLSVFLFFSTSAQGATLTISGNKFLLDGQAKFLVFAGYFDGMDSPNPSADLTYLKSKNIDGIRIFPNLWDYDPEGDDRYPPGTNPVINSDGSINQSRLAKLISIIDAANAKGMIVDVTFARETIEGSCRNSGIPRGVMCKEEFKKGVVTVVQALRNKTNVLYDLSNEHDYVEIINFPRSDVIDLKNRIENAIGTDSILSVSTMNPDGAEAVRIANGYPMDIVNAHFAGGQELNANISSSLTQGKPTYISEPNNTSSVPSYSVQDLVQAVTRAKRSGVAAWLFHTDAAFDLNGRSLQSKFESRGNESGFLSSFKSALDATPWDIGGGGTVDPPISPSSPTALYCSSWLSSDTKPACGCYIGGGTATGTKQNVVKNAMTAVLPSWENSTDVAGFKRAVVAYLNSRGEVSAVGNNGNCNQSANNLAIQTGVVNGIMMGEMYEIARDVLGCNDETNPTLGESTPCRPNSPYVGSWDFVGRGLSPVACTTACSAPPQPPATNSPNITSISPTTAVPGQKVEVYGTNLSDDTQLVDSGGTSTDVESSVNNQLTATTFEIPLDIASGVYRITVTNSKGSVTSTQNLTIRVGGQPFGETGTLTPPTQGLPTDLGQLIKQIFTWSLGILGISVFVMFFYSGFLYLTAAGNTSRTGEAKTHMTNAVFGAILLLSSYLILYTINPDFVKSTFELPGLKTTSTNDDSGPDSCSNAVPLPVPPGSPPNMSSVVNAVATEFPQYLSNSCQDKGGTWDFMDEVVRRLNAQDPNWGYNGKRGNTSDLSEDAISYLAGGTTSVFVIDIIGGHCGDNPTPTWIDQTEATYLCGVTGAYVYPR